jgi:hypothetical protein
MPERKRKTIRCDCGRDVYCGGFTNTCECGADYNMSGQRLANRSQWGEETGETADDILRAEAEGFPEIDY